MTLNLLALTKTKLTAKKLVHTDEPDPGESTPIQKIRPNRTKIEDTATYAK